MRLPITSSGVGGRGARGARGAIALPNVLI